MSLIPARHPNGISFRVTGSPAKIPARLSRLTFSDRTVRLADGETVVTGVEHVLAAVGGLGICCLDIELSSGEVPGLDGSAQPFVCAMDGAGLMPCGGETQVVSGVSISIAGSDGMRIAIEATSMTDLEVFYSVDYSTFGGPTEAVKLRIDEGVFRRELAPARTFAITGLDGRALPGLDGPTLWTSTASTERRFPNELVRHKVLDLIGDLVLVGAPVVGRVSVHRGGHALHHRLAQAIERWHS